MRLFNFFKAYILNALRFIKKICAKKALTNIIAQLYNTDHSDFLKAFSAALGVFIGIMPVWGFQTMIAIFIAVVFRLNKALVVIFSQVSFPLLIPLVMFLSYRIGSYFMSGNSPSPIQPTYQNFNSHLQQYIYGSIFLAFSAAIITGLLIFFIFKLVKALKQFKWPTVIKKASMSVSN